MQTIILQLKEAHRANPEAALWQLAYLSLHLFGKGGNPDAAQIEDYLGYVNTPVQGPGLLRVLVADEFADTIRALGENDVCSVLDTEPTWTETDEDGNERICHLGVIA